MHNNYEQVMKYSFKVRTNKSLFFDMKQIEVILQFLICDCMTHEGINIENKI